MLSRLASRGTWPDVGLMFISPDRSKAWYIAARSRMPDLLWGVCVSAKTFKTGTVPLGALSDWKPLPLDRVAISKLAVRWLARGWSLPPVPVDN